MNECDSDPCAMGARCVDALSSYTCQCTTGFTGRNCDRCESVKMCSTKQESFSRGLGMFGNIIG